MTATDPPTTRVVAGRAQIGAGLLAGLAEELADATTPRAALAVLARVEATARKVRTRLVVGLVLDDGWTYAQVGRALGVTRQAAVKTYGPAVAEQMRRTIRRRG